MEATYEKAAQPKNRQPNNQEANSKNYLGFFFLLICCFSFSQFVAPRLLHGPPSQDSATSAGRQVVINDSATYQPN